MSFYRLSTGHADIRQQIIKYDFKVCRYIGTQFLWLKSPSIVTLVPNYLPLVSTILTLVPYYLPLVPNYLPLVPNYFDFSSLRLIITDLLNSV